RQYKQSISMSPGMLTNRAETRLQRAFGVGSIITKMRGGHTCLDRLYQEGCARIRFPRAQSHALEAVLINTAGGLTGGDHLEWNVEAAPQARLVLTTQACERVYRSTGESAHVSAELKVCS